MSQDNPQTSLAAVTALTRLQAKPHEDLNNSNISANESINSTNSDFNEDVPKKSNLAKLKSSNVITRSELQDLNVKLGAYLDRAKALEQLNQSLLRQVEEARALKVPKNEDRKELANAVDQARLDLENESKDCVMHELNIEKDEGARQEYINRIKFYQAEADAQKQKIAKLLQELADISDEREYILRSARQVENDISREQNTMNRAENELDELRQKLADIKNKNKHLEFEMQTLQDETEFCKAVHDEELTELKNLNKSIPSTRDLNKFYKDQLAQAVKDIKGDFRRLNQQQLDDLKAQKEEELANAKDIAQKQKAAAALRSAPGVSNLSLIDLPDISKQERDELRQLLAKNNDLQKHLANLEEELARQRANNADEAEKKDNELKELKDLNDSYLNELGYWDRVTRAKLQSELVAYSGLLNAHFRAASDYDNQNQQAPQPVKLISTAPVNAICVAPAPVVVKPSEVIITPILPPKSPSPPPKVATPPPQEPLHRPTKIQPVEEKPQPSKTKSSDIYDHLRKVFDMFDKDKSGYINSLEFQDILSVLDINLSPEGYDQILKEGDLDNSRDIDFVEFCRIMEPAISGSFNRDELYQAFKHFDKDNSGYITVKELYEILSYMGQSFSEQQIQNLISTVDENNDGRLDFEEFYALLTRPIDYKPAKTNVQNNKVAPKPAPAPEEPVVQESVESKKYDVLRKVFNLFDKDKSGYINSSEFNDVLQALELQISDDAYESILRDANLDDDRDISFPEFCKIMEPALSGDFNREELYEAFKHFDKDKSGFISVQELNQILTSIGQTFTDDQIAKMVARVDKDNDGRLNFEEFYELLTTPL